MTRNTIQHVSNQFDQHEGRKFGPRLFLDRLPRPKISNFQVIINIVVLDIDMGVFDYGKRFKACFKAIQSS